MADHKALVSDGGQQKRVPDADSLIVGAGAKTVGGTLLVQESRTVTGGAGLTGGGDLTTDRTLDVGAGNGILVAVDSVAVDYGAAPVDVDTAAASAGASNQVSRADHKHDISTAAAGTIEPDDAAAEGASASLARADHKHAIAADVPVDVGTANAEGASTSFSRGSHVHALPVKWRRQHADFEKEADVASLTATAERPVFRAEEAVTVTGVLYLPGAALTGDDANNATLVVRRRDNAGATPVTVASLTTTAAPNNSFVAFDAKSLGALTNTALAADEVLTFEITKAGTGVVVPAGELVVNYTVD